MPQIARCFFFLLSTISCSSAGTIVEDSSADVSAPDTDGIEDPEEESPSTECADVPSVELWNWQADCDEDGVEDAEEIALGLAMDCNQNAIPDNCEAFTLRCTQLGRESYTEYRTGTLPIIISAPHGGDLKPDEIPVRANASTGSDMQTIALAEAINDGLERITGQRAHIVFCHLHRWRLECNRNKELGTEGNPFAEQAWTEFHGYIDAAKEAVTWGYGRGLYLDIHGLAASRDKIELGYLLTGSQYTRSDGQLEHPGYQLRSSFRSLALASSLTLPELLRGPNSIGALLEAEGYPVVPSPSHPDPGYEDGSLKPYFNGGYNTARHGSFYGGAISGVQLEHIWEGVRDTPANREAYGQALATVLVSFIENTMEIDLDTRSRLDVVADSPHIHENGEGTTVSLIRRGDLSMELSVSVQLEGTAQATEDFLPFAREYVFAAGVETIDIAIQPIDDSWQEGQETIIVRVDADHAIVDNRKPLSLRLIDDEATSVWLQAAESGEEGAAISFLLQRDRCATSLNIPLLWSGTGVPDFPLPETVAFEPDSSLHHVALFADQDGAREGRENLEILIGSGTDFFTADPSSARVDIEDVDLDPELQGWWSLQSEEGIIVDRAGRHNGLLLSQGSVMNADHPVYPALHFEEDLLWMEDRPLGVDGVFSLSFFFRAAPDPDMLYAYMWSHGSYSYRNSLNIYFQSSGGIKTAIRGAEEEWNGSLVVNRNLMDEAWHHYALVVDPNIPKVTIYIDGEEEISGAIGLGGVDPSSHIHIGMRSDLSPSRNFTGDLAEITLYSRALSNEEIASIVANGQ